MPAASVHAAVRRVAALDVGLRRIGVAVSDELGLTAQGLPTVQRRNRATDRAAFEALAERYGIRLWVVGLPLHLSGREGRQAEKVREFAGWLSHVTAIPCVFQDERLTTSEATRVLREAELSLNKRRQAVDRLAAVLILQSYLENPATALPAPAISEASAIPDAPAAGGTAAGREEDKREGEAE